MDCQPSTGRDTISKKSLADNEDDYDVAERAIFNAEIKAASLLYEAEKIVFNTLFDGLEEKPLHDSGKETTQHKGHKIRGGKDGAINIAAAAPENWYGQTGKPFFEAEIKAADMLYKAEQAIEHAVEEEVKTFFPDLHHHAKEE